MKSCCQQSGSLIFVLDWATQYIPIAQQSAVQAASLEGAESQQWQCSVLLFDICDALLHVDEGS